MHKEKAGKNSARYPVLLLAMLLAIALRLFRLDGQSIWGDESLTLLRYSRGDTLIEFLRHSWQTGGHPPLYFLISHYWCKLGQSEFMLRFPAMVFGAAAVPVMYALVNRLLDRRAAYIAAFVVALSPIHIWYSQEARMYSLQILLSLLSTLFFLKSLQERRARDFALYALFTAMALYTQMVTIYLLAAQGVFGLMDSYRHWKRMSAILCVQAVLVMAFVPWLMNSSSMRQARSGDVIVGYAREISPADLGYVFYTFCVGFTMGPSVAELHEASPMDAIAHHWSGVFFPLAVFGLLIVLGFVEARKTDRWLFKFLLTLMLAPIAVVVLLAVKKGLPLNPRYLLMTAIPFWIVLTLGIRTCMRTSVLRILPVTAALVVAISLYNHYFRTEYAKQDIRSAAAIINCEAKPGDVIIISSIELGGPFIYYYQRPDVPYVGYPPSIGLVDSQKLPKDLKKILQNKNRAWLVLGRTWSSDPEGMIPDYFNDRSYLLKSRHFPGITTLCYRLDRKFGK